MKRGVIAVLALVFLPMAVAAAEVKAPPVGQEATYSCTGTYGGEYRYTVEDVSDGVVRYRVSAGGNARTLTMPLWLLGTSLYLKDEGGGYGAGRMTGGLEKFAGLRALPVGQEFVGSVTEVAAGQPLRTWQYSVRIVEARQANHPVLGAGEVYVLKEHRSAGGRWSEREAQLSPTNAELVSSTYTDSDGSRRECRLVALKKP